MRRANGDEEEHKKREVKYWQWKWFSALFSFLSDLVALETWKHHGSGGKSTLCFVAAAAATAMEKVKQSLTLRNFRWWRKKKNWSGKLDSSLGRKTWASQEINVFLRDTLGWWHRAPTNRSRVAGEQQQWEGASTAAERKDVHAPWLAADKHSCLGSWCLTCGREPQVKTVWWVSSAESAGLHPRLTRFHYRPQQVAWRRSSNPLNSADLSLIGSVHTLETPPAKTAMSKDQKLAPAFKCHDKKIIKLRETAV